MGNRGKTLGLITAALSMFTGTLSFAGECRDDQVLVRGDWGQARFTVELADDNQERAQGLMFRESMAKSAGMLFIYPEPKQANFWMKNTLIPLDIMFMVSTGTIRRVHHNAIPHDTTRINGGDGVLAVLEINGGMAKSLGIAEGSQLQHPAFAADTAVWPCP